MNTAVLFSLYSERGTLIGNKQLSPVHYSIDDRVSLLIFASVVLWNIKFYGTPTEEDRTMETCTEVKCNWGTKNMETNNKRTQNMTTENLTAWRCDSYGMNQGGDVTQELCTGPAQSGGHLSFTTGDIPFFLCEYIKF